MEGGGITEEASGRRHQGEGIREGVSWRVVIGKASWRGHHRGGVMEEASGGRHHGSRGTISGSSAIVRGHQGPTEPSGIMWESSGVI